MSPRRPAEELLFEEDLKDGLPPAVRMLRVAELARFQENMLRRSAGLSDEERFAQGVLVGRGQLAQSVTNLVTNTRLSELPMCGPALRSFGGVKALAGRSSDKLSSAELLQVAELYATARRAVGANVENMSRTGIRMEP